VTTEGDEVRARRERLGMHKGELAESAGVNRDTLAAIEAGEGFRRVSLTKIERALDVAEAEAGIDTPPPAAAPSDQPGPRMVSFRIGGLVGDVNVVVEGPIDDIDKLRETVELLLHAANGGNRDN
jgi:transcriptional regulator with XRE-family HTH domain